MGQKTHPLGFRLGITQQHRAAWYSNYSQYASLLEEDDQIRTYLEKLAKTKKIFSKNELKFMEESISSRAIPTPKLLIKDHKDRNEKVNSPPAWYSPQRTSLQPYRRLDIWEFERSLTLIKLTILNIPLFNIQT